MYMNLFSIWIKPAYIDDLVQDCSNPSALALKSCSKPSIWFIVIGQTYIQYVQYGLHFNKCYLLFFLLSRSMSCIAMPTKKESRVFHHDFCDNIQ